MDKGPYNKMNRSQNDEISAQMGKYLLRGYALLDQYCDNCLAPLMKDPKGEYLCVQCSLFPPMMEEGKGEDQKELVAGDVEVTSDAIPGNGWKEMKDAIDRKLGSFAQHLNSLDVTSSTYSSNVDGIISNVFKLHEIHRMVVSMK